MEDLINAPWITSNVSKTDLGFVVMICADGAPTDSKLPAQVYGLTPEQTRARARLIIAAPDLLDELKDAAVKFRGYQLMFGALNFTDRYDDASVCRIQAERCETAIAKATAEPTS